MLPRDNGPLLSSVCPEGRGLSVSLLRAVSSSLSQGLFTSPCLRNVPLFSSASVTYLPHALSLTHTASSQVLTSRGSRFAASLRKPPAACTQKRSALCLSSSPSCPLLRASVLLSKLWFVIPDRRLTGSESSGAWCSALFLPLTLRVTPPSRSFSPLFPSATSPFHLFSTDLPPGLRYRSLEHVQIVATLRHAACVSGCVGHVCLCAFVCVCVCYTLLINS